MIGNEEPGDTIAISDVRIACIIGILPEERTRNQPVIVTAKLWLDLSDAGASADLKTTVDYFALARAFDHILKAGKFRLLESAAMALAAFGRPSFAGEVRRIMRGLDDGGFEVDDSYFDWSGRDGLPVQLVGDAENSLHTQHTGHLRLNPAQCLGTR